jgi:hypothetical protein
MAPSTVINTRELAFVNSLVSQPRDINPERLYEVGLRYREASRADSSFRNSI